MRTSAARFLFVAVFTAMTAHAAAADPIIVGAGGNAASCVPFGCRDADRFQQIYAGTVFPGVFDISAIAFPHTLDQLSNLIDPAVYHIRLASTSRPVGEASADLGSNVGGDGSVVFSGPLAGEVPRGGALSFALATPFRFDPARGNLILDVIKEGGVFFGDDGIYLDFNSAMGGLSSSIWQGDGNLIMVPSGGLVTSFAGEEIAPVPEPATLVLLGSGLAGLMARRRLHQQRDE